MDLVSILIPGEETGGGSKVLVLHCGPEAVRGPELGGGQFL